MLNKCPIFVNGFQRGGTNVLVNLIASHPGVGTLGRETHEVFYGRETEALQKWVRRAFYLPILLATRQQYFWPYRFYPRKPIPSFITRYIDGIFYIHKLLARENRQTFQAENRSLSETAQLRLLCKNVNGVVLLTKLFAEMYPDGIFLGLVRNGFALGEGFIRRGWSVERIGNMYELVCQAMIRDASSFDHYYLLRFEEMIADPLNFTKKVYGYLGLDDQQVEHFRLQAKPSMTKDGKSDYMFGESDREIYWFPPEQLKAQFRQDVNENQIARLTEEQKEQFVKIAEQSMSYFGYLT
ncbi:MAG: sulfotransferase [Chloroflexota bacterium]